MDIRLDRGEKDSVNEIVRFIKSLTINERYEFMGIIRGVQLARRGENTTFPNAKNTEEERIGGKAVYLSKRKIIEEYGICMSTLDKAIRDIRNQIPKRYPQGAVIEHPIRVRDDVFRDFQLYQDEIAAGCAPKFVPNETHVWDKEVV